MKKITHFRRLCVLGLGIILSGFMAVSATQYCHTAITSNDATTQIYMSLQKLSEGVYEIKIESDVDLVGLGGSFVHINGTEAYQLNAAGHFSISEDKKTITIPITSTTAPSPYTPLYVMMPGEKVFTWPSDITWGLCSAQTDFTAPVMTAASVDGSPTFNTVILTLAATDNVTNPVVSFVLNDVVNGIINRNVTANAEGKVTLMGLTPNTTYNITITARDAAGNLSTNSELVTFTTLDRSSECSGDKGHFGTPADHHIHFTITTNLANNDLIYTVTPIEASRTIEFIEVHTTSGYHVMTIAGDKSSATFTHTGLTAGTSVGIRFLYNLSGMVGNSMTAADVTLSDPNIIYFKVGDQCTLSSINILTASDVGIYPTLVKDNLQISSSQEINQIQVKNLLGQTIRVIQAKGLEKSVNLSSLSTGNYIVIVKTAAGLISAQKIVKL